MCYGHLDALTRCSGGALKWFPQAAPQGTYWRPGSQRAQRTQQESVGGCEPEFVCICMQTKLGGNDVRRHRMQNPGEKDLRDGPGGG